MRGCRIYPWIVLSLLCLQSAPAADLPPVEMVLMLREARIAQLQEQTDEALAKLRAAVEAYPESILPVMALWDYHSRYRLPAEEGQRLRDLLTKRLADPRSPLPPGTLRYLVEQENASEEYLTMVLDAVLQRFDKEKPPPRFLEAIAVLQERLGRLPEAREILGELLDLEPSFELRLHCFAIDLHLERWHDVAKLLKAQLEEDPLVFFRMYYIEALAKIGDYQELVRQLDLLSESPEVAQAHFKGPLRGLLLQAAWDLRDAGKKREAEMLFRRLLAIDPDNVGARNAILHLCSSEEERLAHEAALATRWREEEDHDLLAREGGNMLAGGDAAGAFELLERAVAGLPDSESAWFNFGLAAMQLEQWSDADRAMARALEINPSRAEGYLYRGAALQSLERCEEAIPLLEKALSLSAALTQSHFYLYFCHHALGQNEASQEHLALYNESRQGGGE
jgi:tetratricopeptide (TPR) repeat protein